MAHTRSFSPFFGVSHTERVSHALAVPLSLLSSSPSSSSSTTLSFTSENTGRTDVRRVGFKRIFTHHLFMFEIHTHTHTLLSSSHSHTHQLDQNCLSTPRKPHSFWSHDTQKKERRSMCECENGNERRKEGFWCEWQRPEGLQLRRVTDRRTEKGGRDSESWEKTWIRQGERIAEVADLERQNTPVRLHAYMYVRLQAAVWSATALKM